MNLDAWPGLDPLDRWRGGAYGSADHLLRHLARDAAAGGDDGGPRSEMAALTMVLRRHQCAVRRCLRSALASSATGPCPGSRGCRSGAGSAAVFSGHGFHPLGAVDTGPDVLRLNRFRGAVVCRPPTDHARGVRQRAPSHVCRPDRSWLWGLAHLSHLDMAVHCCHRARVTLCAPAARNRCWQPGLAQNGKPTRRVCRPGFLIGVAELNSARIRH